MSEPTTRTQVYLPAIEKALLGVDPGSPHWGNAAALATLKIVPRTPVNRHSHIDLQHCKYMQPKSQRNGSR